MQRSKRSSTRAKSDSPALRLNKILVPIDFSDASKKALDHAVSWAQRFGARVGAIYIEPTALPADITQLPVMLEHEQHRRAARKWLTDLCHERVPPAIRGKLIVQTGAPYYDIVQAAQGQKAQLIVIATHGHSGLTRLLMGSTAERVVEHAHCPVLVVPAGLRRRTSGNGLGIKRIVVGTDFSTSGDQAVRYAAALAREFKSKVALVHVVAPPAYPQFGYAHVPVQEHRMRTEATLRLEKLRDRYGPGTFDQVRVRWGNPYQEITREAKKVGADLLVVGTRGHTGLAHLLLGSTAERVVRHGPCPTLVVRPVESQFLRT